MKKIHDSKEKFPLLSGKPYTIYNCAMSLDGKTSTIENDSRFSGNEDWYRVHALRNSVDGICVGIGTVLSDDPKLRVKFIENPRNPHRIVVDSKLRIPTNAQLVHFEREGVKVYIGTTRFGMNNQEKVKELKNLSVKLIDTSTQDKVDLKILWSCLKEQGINSILVEGGGTLARSLFDEKLIDEVRVYISPVLVSGQSPPATSIIMGKGFKTVDEAIKLKLITIEKVGEGIFASFKVE
ncbi:MAG: 2,5-diamino-6-(ribosylamino)-4(3H)-pyrimidinone 5'-phosphate reductase [Promethearchaeota archaeon]